MPLGNAVQLICYPNRLGSNLNDLHRVPNQYFADCIGGVHILPFFPSNADGGFSPLTHREVDPDYGAWADIQAIAADFDLVSDVTINHISDQSAQFQDYIKKCDQSEFAGLFVDVDKLGNITHDDLAKIHIRKEKEPFRHVTFAAGASGRIWCIFTEHQIDLNFKTATIDYVDTDDKTKKTLHCRQSGQEWRSFAGNWVVSRLSCRWSGLILPREFLKNSPPMNACSTITLELIGKVTLLTVCVPEAKEMSIYDELQNRIEQAVGRINGSFSRVGWTPIQFFFRSLPFEELVWCWPIPTIRWSLPGRVISP